MLGENERGIEGLIDHDDEACRRIPRRSGRRTRHQRHPVRSGVSQLRLAGRLAPPTRVNRPAVGPQIYVQGSFHLGTAIRTLNVEEGYDVDGQVAGGEMQEQENAGMLIAAEK